MSKRECKSKNPVKPNYKQIRESYVHALQKAYNEYGKCQSQWYTNTWFNDEGVFCIFGKESMSKKLEEVSKNLEKAIQDLNDFDGHLRTIEKLGEITNVPGQSD